MPKRAYLLFVLFAVLALFYASVTRQGASSMAERNAEQVQQINQLDEQALGAPGQVNQLAQE